MIELTIKETRKIVEKFYNERMPLYLWGRPSTGKTTIIREFSMAKAKELGLEYSEDEFGDGIFTMKVIPLSQYDAPDLRGIPIAHGGFTEFLPTKEFPRKGQGIVFFDELNLASDDIRAACYQYILEGRYSNIPPIKDKDGKDCFWRIAASNQEQDHCNVNNTGLALLRRFSHIQVIPEIKEVLEYFQEKGIDNRILGYLASYPSDLFPAKYDEKLLEEKANPFPSGWYNVSKLIKNVKDSNEIYTYTACCIGTMVAAKFKGYINKLGKISIDEFLKDPSKYIEKINKEDDYISIIYSLIYEIADIWKNTNKINVKKMIEILNALPNEMTTALVAMIVKVKNKYNSLINDKEFVDGIIRNKIGKQLNELNFNN